MSTETKTAADILNDTTFKLHYIRSVLDLVCTVARAKDPFADIESLSIGTLDNAMSGLLDEIDEIQRTIQENWPVLMERPVTTGGRSEATVVATTPTEYSDDAGERISAFLGSVRTTRGMEEDAEELEGFHSGREAIEQMARTAPDTDNPLTTFPANRCADVLTFLRCVEPVDKVNWWIDPKAAPSHVVGFQLVLICLEESLRLGVLPTAEQPNGNPQKLDAATSEAIERQRVRMFRAMNLVDVTAMSCDEGDVSRRGALEAAHGDIAMELNNISGHVGPLGGEQDDEA
jgi:hypothetical protein